MRPVVVVVDLALALDQEIVPGDQQRARAARLDVGLDAVIPALAGFGVHVDADVAGLAARRRNPSLMEALDDAAGLRTVRQAVVLLDVEAG